MSEAQSYTNLIRLLIALALIVSVGAAVLIPDTVNSADLFPDCNWGCTAGNVYVTEKGAWLGNATGGYLGNCTQGGNVIAYVWAEIYNNTASEVSAVWAFFDLKINGEIVYTANDTLQCDMDSLGSKTATTAMLWGPITWECGRTVEILGLNISWVGPGST